jgi:membrane protease YdiL (CAAX protease family)
MKTKPASSNGPLAIYLLVLAMLCAAVIVGARMLGRQGAYLAQFYMLTPALAALVTRGFFYGPRFSDAFLRFGRLSDYLKYWLISLGIVAAYFTVYTLLGAIEWDLSGDIFLARLAEQFAAAGQDMNASLPPGFTAKSMLLIYFVGGLTVFNVLPGLISGFGEEFGHRGFMFPALYRISPAVGLLVGGLLWFGWHLPLVLIIPQPTPPPPLYQSILNGAVLAIGSIAAFIYLAYVYVKSRSVFVVSLAHIAMNNASASLSYFAAVQDQFMANLGTVLVMLLLVAFLYARGEFRIFKEHFAPPLPNEGAGP